MADQFHGLKVLDFLGVFYRDGDDLKVADEFEGDKSVTESLAKYVGQEIRLIAHHRPHEPIDESRWGGGCCHLENTGHCHFGHHENEQNLYTFNAVGVLRVEGPRWYLDPKDEDSKECLVEFLSGHRAQIIVTTIPDMSKIEEKVKSFDPSNIENATLDELTEKLSEMRDYLAEINRMKNDI